MKEGCFPSEGPCAGAAQVDNVKKVIYITFPTDLNQTIAKPKGQNNISRVGLENTRTFQRLITAYEVGVVIGLQSADCSATIELLARNTTIPGVKMRGK